MDTTNQAVSSAAVLPFTFFTAADTRLFSEGKHYRLYEKMGSHAVTVNGQEGIYFAVWAAHARAVSVTGNFNKWNTITHPLFMREDGSGIWEGFVPSCRLRELYKYHIIGPAGVAADKGDPFACFWEIRPATASITWDLAYEWQDAAWMKERKKHNALHAPWSVYEVHLLSWMRPDKNDETTVNTYAQAIELLVPYVKQMGFTHVEFMPVMEHPFDGSWGYQGTGFFAPTSRFGSPRDFMRLIDAFHREGIGVILDWVPSHFPYDAHGLYMFDGTHAYEHPDMRRGYHPDWNSYIFNYGKGEVKSFLISSARYWMDIFHADGIRVDGVSSMLILNYSRTEGQWEPNEQGGTANLEAVSFLQDMNETLATDFPDARVIAEESTDWKGVSRPVAEGGLGFGMKWMMGWMHDTLEYFQLDPPARKELQDRFTLSMEYYYHENFMLALSHDEVVYGKQPMLRKMPGSEEQQFANLRLLYTYMFTHPGGKLLFMGDEFGSDTEWNYKSELPWALLQEERHYQLRDCVRDLNNLLRHEPALYEKQFDQSGFEWTDKSHAAELVIVYRRKGQFADDDLLIVLNLGTVVQHGWIIHASGKENWSVIFNSDAGKYGGSGSTRNVAVAVKPEDKKTKTYACRVDLPALSAVVLK